jgi:hypothetical protein
MERRQEGQNLQIWLRLILMHPRLQEALVKLHKVRDRQVWPERTVVFSECGLEMSAATMKLWSHRLYRTFGMTGCSSHSGRRSFITRAVRKVSEVGGSIRDVQQLAGHVSMQTTLSDNSERHIRFALTPQFSLWLWSVQESSGRILIEHSGFLLSVTSKMTPAPSDSRKTLKPLKIERLFFCVFAKINPIKSMTYAFLERSARMILN